MSLKLFTKVEVCLDLLNVVLPVLTLTVVDFWNQRVNNNNNEYICISRNRKSSDALVAAD